jgi:hypothetical protein
MQHRRSLRVVAGALVLALPLLASCGFDRKTNVIYTPAAGTDNRDGVVDVLSAVVVAAQPDSGTFIATLSNNSVEDADSFDSIKGAGDWSDLQVAEVSPAVEIPARGFVNLADQGGVNVTGDFGAGDFLTVTLSFGSGQTTTMQIPVVYACDEYTGLDSSGAGAASPSSQTEDSESPSPGEVPTDGTSASGSESPTASATTESSASSDSSASSSSTETYDCGSVLEED